MTKGYFLQKICFAIYQGVGGRTGISIFFNFEIREFYILTTFNNHEIVVAVIVVYSPLPGG